jgi:hypothetical protein
MDWEATEGAAINAVEELMSVARTDAYEHPATTPSFLNSLLFLAMEISFFSFTLFLT